MTDYKKIADGWRKANPGHDTGVVLISCGNAYGWKNKLRDASHESPGVIAVDAEGHIFKAEGGDDYNGAKGWVAV